MIWFVLFFLFIITLRTSNQCQIFISVYLDYWSLAYHWFLYVPPPPFSFWNITVLWSNTTQIVITHICVIFSRRTMSLSICSMVQLYIGLQYRREWKYSTNINCHCQSKTEQSKGCNYYLPDLKSDCNNGGKLLYCTGSHLKIQRVPNYMCMHLNFHSFHIFFYFIFSL